ncbi:hypothetical protein D3C72_847740 [compost metagenome]
MATLFDLLAQGNQGTGADNACAALYPMRQAGDRRRRIAEAFQALQVFTVAGAQVAQQRLERSFVVAHQVPQVLQVEQAATVIGFRHRPCADQGLGEAVEVQGLEQAIVHPRLAAAPAIDLLGAGGQADQPTAWAPATALVLADRTGQSVAVQPRHVAVTDDHIEMLLQPQAQGLCAIFRHPGLVPEIIQLLRQQQPVGRVVVHHQHPQPRARFDIRQGRCASLRPRARQQR